MIRKIIFFILFISIISFGIYAQGENLTIKIAVMGPGSQVYFWWGHIAMIIEDSFTENSYFFDYGLFSFDNENFYYNFAFGRLLYSCGVSHSNSNINDYIFNNRDITIYTLDVPPEKKVEVMEFALENVHPDNRDYFYHHFRDNCSTRIRDIIDIATDGQFWDQFGREPGRFTLREHVRRHTWFSPFFDWLLCFLMGQGIDSEITVWDEMFLPSEVGKQIDNFWYTGADGVMRKLVSKTEAVFSSQGRPQVLDVPRRQWLAGLVFSLALAVLFGFFFYLQSKKIKIGQILAGSSFCITGLFFGIAGLLLYFMSILTDHDYTFNNANMFYATPLLLAAVPLGICYALTKENYKIFIYGVWLRLIWLITLLGIFVSMLIKLLPQFWQDNLFDQMLMLPIALVFVFQPVGLRELQDWIFRKKNPFGTVPKARKIK